MGEQKGALFFLSIFLLSSGALFWLYAPFLVDLLIAFLIFLATQSLYFRIQSLVRSSFLAAFFVVFGLLFLCVLPIVYVCLKLLVLTSEAQNIQNFIWHVVANGIFWLQNLASYLPKALSNELEGFLAQAQSFDWVGIIKHALGVLAQGLKNSAFFVSDGVLILVFLFCFYIYARSLGAYLLALIPIDSEQITLLYAEVSGVINVVFYSALASMLLQGFLFGSLVAFYGYEALLFGVLYGLASFVPVVGGALVWVFCVGYELYLGNIWQGVVIGVYCVVVIGFLADNVIKPFLIGFISRLLGIAVAINEWLIFFAILAGLISFGFWGIILGPAITAFFIALLRVYENLYR